MSAAPKKALRLNLTIDAHDEADLSRILDQFALDVSRDAITLTSGCSSAGWEYRVDREAEPLTREQYEAELMDWFHGRRA